MLSVPLDEESVPETRASNAFDEESDTVINFRSNPPSSKYGQRGWNTRHNDATGNPIHNLSNMERSMVFSVDQDEERRRMGLGVRTILTAVILFGGGLAMCISGAVFYWHSGVDHGLDLFIVGFIMMFPGSYGLILILGYCLRWPGYEEPDRLPFSD